MGGSPLASNKEEIRGAGLGGGRAPRTVLPRVLDQPAVSEVSSMTKLVCSDESSFIRNFTETVLPL